MISAEDVIEMSGVETLHPGGLDLSRRIAELVHMTPTTRILDVSCGKGVFACLYAKEFGCSVTGIDINPQFIEIARQRAHSEGVADKVEFKVGDSRKLPFQDAEFDVVVNECAVGLTAIGDPEGVLREMVRVTKVGGKVVIHESTWLKELPVPEKTDLALRMGTVPYAVDEWQRMLHQAGARSQVVEDWSGVDNFLKMRPGYKGNPNSPDIFTLREKVALAPRIALKYGLSSILDLLPSLSKLTGYFKDGYFGYALIVASRDSANSA